MKKMKIAVIDGQGGGIGRSIVEKLKASAPNAEVLALGTNATATDRMLRAGADEGATGENAIIHNVKSVDIITGVIAILNANALMGELSPRIAEAIGASPAFKVLLPINRCGIYVVSVQEAPLSTHIENAVAAIGHFISENSV
jgi:NAD(P)-dependent dehydrogenase (short-subunit alcohol dehydrogenase family)